VLTELTDLSVVEWSTADESALETGADLTGLAAATGDELPAAFAADFDTDDL